jgi:hypothetical protein
MRASGAALLLTLLVFATAAEPLAAQIVIGRGSGVIINAPGVGVRLGPIGIYGPYGGYLRGRLAARPTLPTNSSPANLPPLPSTTDWRGMDESQLLNSVVQTAERLDRDLGGFTSAASWRNYLRLPGDALSPPDANRSVRLKLTSVAETLSRFESAGANPEYRQITSLPSYTAMRDALGEVVRRYGGNVAASEQANAQRIQRPSQRYGAGPSSASQSYAAAKPPAGEELPAPSAAIAPKNEPALQGPQNAQAEHSILSR